MNENWYFFIINLIIAILLWWIKPTVAKRFFKKQGPKILKYVYFAIATTITIIMIFSLVIVSFNYIPGKLITVIAFGCLTLLSVFGVWLPLAYSIKGKRIEKIINITGACFLGVLFIIYWIIEWPKWQTPTLITSLVALVFVVSLIAMYIEKRRLNAKKVIIKKSSH